MLDDSRLLIEVVMDDWDEVPEMMRLAGVGGIYSQMNDEWPYFDNGPLQSPT